MKRIEIKTLILLLMIFLTVTVTFLALEMYRYNYSSELNVDFEKQIGKNNLELGVEMVKEFYLMLNDSIFRDKFTLNNFKIVRTPPIEDLFITQPALYWDDSGLLLPNPSFESIWHPIETKDANHMIETPDFWSIHYSFGNSDKMLAIKEKNISREGETAIRFTLAANNFDGQLSIDTEESLYPIDENLYLEGGNFQYPIKGPAIYPDQSFYFYDKYKNFLSRRWAYNTSMTVDAGGGWQIKSSVWSPSYFDVNDPKTGGDIPFIPKGTKYIAFKQFIKWKGAGTTDLDVVFDEFFVRQWSSMPTDDERVYSAENPPTPTHSGVYEWSDLDEYVDLFSGMGQELLVTIGGFTAGSAQNEYNLYGNIPLGMSRNLTTSLPLRDKWSTYASDIVRHFKENNMNVKYIDLWNEPMEYLFLGKSYMNQTHLEFFVDVLDEAIKRIRQIDPQIKISSDISLYKDFFNYFVEYGEGLDFLDYHKYDAWGTWLVNPEGYLSDEDVLKRAEQPVKNPGTTYSPREAKQLYLSKRGSDLPVIYGEINLNSQWHNGTDPRIQQIIGAVWYAETIRTYVLNDLNYAIYYKFSSNDKKPTEGYGFGMINNTAPFKEWYPYWVAYLIGNNLDKDSYLYDSFSSDFSTISTLAWKSKDDNSPKILLISKTRQPFNVHVNISHLNFDAIIIEKLDKNKEHEIQTSVIYPLSLFDIQLDGYSVVLLSPRVIEVSVEGSGGEGSRGNRGYIVREETKVKSEIHTEIELGKYDNPRFFQIKCRISPVTYYLIAVLLCRVLYPKKFKIQKRE